MKRLHTYSQHFLRSPQLVSELIGHSNIKKNDIVYDLGAGSGVISSILAKRCKAVIAVEQESQTAILLQKNMQHYENVTVRRADLLELEFPDGPYKIFSNIPFSVSAELVHRLTSLATPPEATYLIVQKQFAQKLVVDGKSFSSMLGASIAPWFRVRIRKPLKRTDYWPHPNVDTVLIEIMPHETPLLSFDVREKYQMFVRHCFENQKFYAKLANIPLGNGFRKNPSQLVVEEWLDLFKANVR